jgi:outer membrane protein assembly factor BamB
LYKAHLATAAFVGIVLASAPNSLPGAFASTFEAWEFKAQGDILALSAAKDASGDGIDEFVVAAGRFVYLADGATGEEIWNYTTNDSYTWIAATTHPSLDVSGDGRPDVLAAAAEDRLVMLLDGANGEQIWNFSGSGSSYKQGDLCYPSARWVHLVSDIDGDGLPDMVVVSGSGDQCPKDDRFEVIALSAMTGEKLWEYVHDEDYHGLKDGTRASSPVAVVDVNKDGAGDIAIVDDHNALYVINGLTGSVIRTEKLDVFGAIWNLMVVPDISGDGIEDAIAFEFINGAGGPDYASIDAVDLASAKVVWQAKAGDGLYDGGALYTGAWLASGNSVQPAIHVAVTQRIENKLDLLLLNGNTGQEILRFHLGEDKSRDDLGRYYPIQTVPDLNGNGYDELAVGSIDSTIRLLDGKELNVIWSHSVDGGCNLISSIPAGGDQRYILVADKKSNVNALGALTSIETELTIDASAETVILSRQMTISGGISPLLPGEIVQLRYVDPTGSATMKPIVIARDGSYTDTIKPNVIGSWKVSASFAGDGYYTSTVSPTIAFTVENETKNSVYRVKIESDAGTSVSYPVVYFVEGGQVNEMSVDRQQRSLSIAITPVAGGGALRLELSRSMMDAWDSSYQVYVDGKVVEFNEIESNMEKRVLSIPFSEDSEQIQVIGTYIVPEFPIAQVMLALAIVGVTAVLAMQSRLFSMCR